MALRTTTLGFACMLLGAAACSSGDVGAERRIAAHPVVIRLPERLGAPERPAVARQVA